MCGWKLDHENDLELSKTMKYLPQNFQAICSARIQCTPGHCENKQGLQGFELRIHVVH